MPQNVKRRQFIKLKIQKLLYLLHQATCPEAYAESNVKAKFKTFLNIFHYHYSNIAFTVTTVYLKE